MASSASKTVSPATIVIAAITVGVLIILGSNYLPSRMPPDPFEEDELREVIIEVEWDGDRRGQLIAWDVGDDEGELYTGGIANVNAPGWHWNHITTAQEGTRARVSAVQDSPGPVLCAIYVFNRQVAADDTTDPHGCFAEVTIP